MVGLLPNVASPPAKSESPSVQWPVVDPPVHAKPRAALLVDNAEPRPPQFPIDFYGRTSAPTLLPGIYPPAYGVVEVPSGVSYATMELIPQCGIPYMPENNLIGDGNPNSDVMKLKETHARPILVLDLWRDEFGESPKDPEAEELREEYPDYVPVIVEKDARSDIPDIDEKIVHLVPGEMPLGKYASNISIAIWHTQDPIHVSFKKTVPPVDAIMCAIYAENKDDDGFLHLTYSGEARNASGRLVQPVKIDLAVVSFSARCDTRNLVNTMSKHVDMKENAISPLLLIFEESIPATIRVEEMFDYVNSKLPGPPLLLLCILPGRKNSAHNSVLLFLSTLEFEDIYMKVSPTHGLWKGNNLCELGVVTQCIAPTKGNDQYTTHVLLKINGKLGGMNSLLTVEHCLPLVSKCPSLIMEMGLSHGSPGRSDVPSIAAVFSCMPQPLIAFPCKPLSHKDCEGIIRELLLDFYTASYSRNLDQVDVHREPKDMDAGGGGDPIRNVGHNGGGVGDRNLPFALGRGRVGVFGPTVYGGASFGGDHFLIQGENLETYLMDIYRETNENNLFRHRFMVSVDMRLFVNLHQFRGFIQALFGHFYQRANLPIPDAYRLTFYTEAYGQMLNDQDINNGDWGSIQRYMRHCHVRDFFQPVVVPVRIFGYLGNNNPLHLIQFDIRPYSTVATLGTAIADILHVDHATNFEYCTIQQNNHLGWLNAQAAHDHAGQGWVNFVNIVQQIRAFVPGYMPPVGN